MTFSCHTCKTVRAFLQYKSWYTRIYNMNHVEARKGMYTKHLEIKPSNLQLTASLTAGYHDGFSLRTSCHSKKLSPKNSRSQIYNFDHPCHAYSMMMYLYMICTYDTGAQSWHKKFWRESHFVSRPSWRVCSWLACSSLLVLSVFTLVHVDEHHSVPGSTYYQEYRRR